MHWVCKECTTQYAVDAPQCPHCGATEHWDSFEYEELMMGKITKHGGLTDQATGAGFSDDPDDERPAGTRVAENTGEPAQTDGPLDSGEPTGSESDAPEGSALPPAEEHAGEELTADSYDMFTKPDLIAEAERRDPPVDASGTKADIIARLREDDARTAEQGA